MTIKKLFAKLKEQEIKVENILGIDWPEDCKGILSVPEKQKIANQMMIL